MRTFLLVLAFIGSPIPWKFVSITTTLGYTFHWMYLAVAKKTAFQRIKDRGTKIYYRHFPKREPRNAHEDPAYFCCASTGKLLTHPVFLSDCHTNFYRI